MRRVLAVGALFAALLIGVHSAAFAGGDPHGGSNSSHGDVKVLPASNHVTGHYASSCKAVGKLPDKNCTPGSVSDAVNQGNIHQTVCVRGYTTKIRPPQSETGPIKTAAMKAYGLAPSLRSVTELDHLVPLELGGSSDTSNLWAERSDLPHGFLNRKDGVESQLHGAVCSDKVQLKTAQDAIAADWTTALHKAGIS